MGSASIWIAELGCIKPETMNVHVFYGVDWKMKKAGL